MRDFHPVANLFPLIEGQAFDDLVADIRQQGLLVPITIDQEGRILDGRNRARACAQLGIEAQHTLYEGPATAFIVSMNLKRRHLTIKQRAFIAARLVTSPVGGGRNGSIEPGMVSAEAAADLLQVSRHTVHRARTVLQHGDPATIDAVEHGDQGLAPAAAAIWSRHPHRHDGSIEPSPAAPVNYRTKEGQALRLQLLKDLAAQGYASRQMAPQIGISEERCRLLMKQHGIPCPGDKAMGKGKRFRADTLMDNLVFAAEHLLADVNLIAFDELDSDRLQDWVPALKAAHRALGVFIRQLTGKKDRDNAQHTAETGPTDSTGREDTSSPHCHDEGATSPGHPARIQ